MDPSQSPALRTSISINLAAGITAIGRKKTRDVEDDVQIMKLDLVSTTFSAVTVPGMSHGDAAREIVDGINADLGTAHDIKRLGQWRRGERSIPQPVQDWMLRTCIAHAITQCGGIAPADDSDLDRLAAMLCPPAR